MSSNPVDPWTTLGISPTDDPRKIRRAYAAGLRAIDVAGNPKGFQRLREAFEQACRPCPASGDAIQEDAPDEGNDPRADASATSGALAWIDQTGATPNQGSHPTDPAGLATQVLRTLARMPEVERRGWLESREDLESIDLRSRLERVVLDRLVADYARWAECVSALSAYFEWEYPLDPRDHRERQLRRLAALREQAEFARRAPSILETLASLPTLVARLQWLQQAPDSLEEGLELALLRELSQRPVFGSACAWALVTWFRWDYPEAATSERSLLLRALLDPQGQPWARLRDVAVADLLRELRSRNGTTEQRRFLAFDPRLEDPRWRPVFEAELRAHHARQPQAVEAHALALHFGWNEQGPTRGPGAIAPRGRSQPMRMDTAVLIAVLVFIVVLAVAGGIGR
jgi:hypothetical protein